MRCANVNVNVNAIDVAENREGRVFERETWSAKEILLRIW